MGKLKNIRFDLPIMFCLIMIIAVTVYIGKAVKFKFDEDARPTLHLYAVSYVLPKRPDWPPIRSLHYCVSFPGLANKPRDTYIDDCTGVEPGFLNQVNASGSSMLYVALEPGLVTNATSPYPAITARMHANFELLKKLVAEQYDMSQIDWSSDQSGNKLFSLDLKLPSDFLTALP